MKDLNSIYIKRIYRRYLARKFKLYVNLRTSHKRALNIGITVNCKKPVWEWKDVVLDNRGYPVNTESDMFDMLYMLNKIW